MTRNPFDKAFCENPDSQLFAERSDTYDRYTHSALTECLKFKAERFGIKHFYLNTPARMPDLLLNAPERGDLWVSSYNDRALADSEHTGQLSQCMERGAASLPTLSLSVGTYTVEKT